MVKTVPSNVWAAGSIPSRGATILQESESVSRSVVSDPMHVVCQAPLSMKISGQEYTYLAAKNENIKQKQHCNKFSKDLKNGLRLKRLSSSRSLLSPFQVGCIILNCRHSQ